ncbi:unnamed protein product [Moneuplotes crassus]|uniref:Uncharacterized protein n=1 Tax=Euplotes crassus TaxID=5936 RepID=A0AAD1URG3_EUPCR|nr:unnamed protein product [Moneuplotes crassus]
MVRFPVKFHLKTLVLPNVTTGCEGDLKDIQYDFYGTSIAVCDTAGKVQIIDQTQPEEKFHTFPHAHSGVVAGVDWAHPEFGSIVVSAGEEDHTIKFWKNVEGIWEESFPTGYFGNEMSVYNENFSLLPDDPKLGIYLENENISCLKFAPKEYGCCLFVGCESGAIYTLNFVKGRYDLQEIHSFDGKILTISFGPSTYSLTDIEESENDPGLAPIRFAVAVEGNSRIFQVLYKKDEQWISETIGHHDNAQCNTVSWGSNIGSHADILASGGDDKNILVWSKDRIDSDWIIRATINLAEEVSSVSWNQRGPTSLQATLKDGTTLIFKETMLDNSKYDLMAEINPEGEIFNSE